MPCQFIDIPKALTKETVMISDTLQFIKLLIFGSSRFLTYFYGLVGGAVSDQIGDEGMGIEASDSSATGTKLEIGERLA
jgi:uncharacterized membrane protein